MGEKHGKYLCKGKERKSFVSERERRKRECLQMRFRGYGKLKH